ncbi:MAG TPA: hypothetical protein VLE47_02850 [Candidatus Saccharimonadales bacterium]|nr:hypothetical protein [Candidatus Saccharimonadales bacterium]
MKRVLITLGAIVSVLIVGVAFSGGNKALAAGGGYPGPFCYGGTANTKVVVKASATVCTSNYGETINVNAVITRAKANGIVAACYSDETGDHCSALAAGHFDAGRDICVRYVITGWTGPAPTRVEFLDSSFNQNLATAPLTSSGFAAANNVIAQAILNGDCPL